MICKSYRRKDYIEITNTEDIVTSVARNCQSYSDIYITEAIEYPSNTNSLLAINSYSNRHSSWSKTSYSELYNYGSLDSKYLPNRTT